MPELPTTHHLDVPGARLYYEVRGSGPLLLVIGQPMTSSAFGPLADLLADRHTVVTYDPHGLGQSSVSDPSLDVTPEIQADDLAQLIDEVGVGPADLFATSGGAVAGLALAAHHPDRVRTLIAHEPPVTELLPDAPYVRAATDDIEDAYRVGGSGAAWGKFVPLVMHDGEVTAAGIPPTTRPPAGEDAAGIPPTTRPPAGEDAAGIPPTTRPPAGEDGAAVEAAADEVPGSSDPDQVSEVPSQKQRADDELFFLRMLKPFTRYEPAVESLRSGRPRLVVAVGEASGEELAARSAVALAKQLGISTTTFPGDHGGFMADPEGFASAIRRVLT